jgi:hypothetical protein
MMCLLVAAAVAAAVPPFASAAEPPPPLTRSAKSGPWSAADTWEGGKVPAAGARVQVRTGHTVVYDVKADAVIRSVHAAGTLTFARDKDTLLNVGLIKIQPGDDASENGFDCDAHAGPAAGDLTAPGPRPWRSAPRPPRSRPAGPPSSGCTTSRAWTRKPARRSCAVAGAWTFTGRRSPAPG